MRRASSGVYFASVALAVLCAVAGASCGGVAGVAPSVQSKSVHVGSSPIPIAHIIIIVQENRSFDNLFNGFPGADTAQQGKLHDGAVVALHSSGLSASGDPGHSHHDFKVAYNGGQMNGFDLETFTGSNTLVGTFPYAYVPQSSVSQYWTLASAYTLADRMFQSNTGPSFPAHQYLIAGQSANVDGRPNNNPWGCDAPAGTTTTMLNSLGQQVAGPFPCFSYTTLADLLDQAGISWRTYTPKPLTNWNGFQAISQIRYGRDWTTAISSPETNILNDIAAGTLPSVSWVIPRFGNSDHPGLNATGGPQWVASITNAIGASNYWNDTAVLVVWDDWGGWYDHVAPPQLDIMGLSMRVPLLVVSRYAKRGYVSHVNYEFGSILKYAEEVFNLPSLGATDARANSLDDCFDYSLPYQSYRQVKTQLTAWHFLNENAPPLPPDSD